MILLIVAAGLGVYIWQHNKVTSLQKKLNATKTANITNTKTSTSSTATKTSTVSTSANPYAGWKSHCSTVGDLCYKYPASWTLSSSIVSNGPDQGQEADTITSPSGATVVSYGGGGIGHYQPNGTVNVLDADSFSSNFQQVALAVYNNATSGSPADYSTDVFVTNNSSTEYSDISTPFKTGDTYSISTNNTGFMEDDLEFANNIRASFNIVMNSNNDAFTTLADAQNWYNSADVQTAVLILRSAEVNNQ